jgi:epoxyqueuosine reductase
MTAAERTAWICERARRLGFDLCGVADPDALAELSHLPEWLERGYAGEMNYLREPRRADPRLILAGVRSLIVVALNYNSAQPHSREFAASTGDDSPRGWISRYAWGDDYHGVIGRKLDALLAAMRAEFAEAFEARAYVDTGPIVERVAAKYAGLGWLAKNTCLINRELGSWLFLGVIVTTLELAPSLPRGEMPPADLCGSCTACLDACPTQAFAAPYVLDARRCISYLTIELRGVIPEELRDGVGQAVFGCDICQDVCPWNREPAITSAEEFAPRKITEQRESKIEIRNSRTEDQHTDVAAADSLCAKSGAGEGNRESLRSLLTPELGWLAALSQTEFSATFRGSAVKRAKWRGMVRNACVALGNAALPVDRRARSRITRVLESLSRAGDPLIVEHARWALEKVNGRNSKCEIRNPNGHNAIGP